MAHYLKIWFACVRYSLARAMMFRFDFLMWSFVELFWMMVNLLLVSVIYLHTDEIGGWSKYEMLLLQGTSMLMQRLLFGLFWSNLFELGRNIRDGKFDFLLAQPGNPIFMVSTRKLDFDSLANGIVAAGVVLYSLGRLGIEISAGGLSLYLFSMLCALLTCYGILLAIVSLSFWVVGNQGAGGAYYALFEFSRLPKSVFRGGANVFFVWILPVVVVSNVPAGFLIRGFCWTDALWLFLAMVVWAGIGIFVFNKGLRRYASASS